METMLFNQTWRGLSNNTKNAPIFQYKFQSWVFLIKNNEKMVQ